MLKYFRKTPQKDYGPNHTADGIKDEGAQNEAARQAENYHKHAFSPIIKVNDDEGEYNDFGPPDVAARTAFYQKHGLRRMTIDDAQTNPHHMAHYLNTMAKHFPDHAKELNHEAINQTTNDQAHQEFMDKYGPSLVSRVMDSFKSRATKVKEMGDDLEKMKQSLVDLNTDPQWKAAGIKFHKQAMDKITDWHGKNPDLHHLEASQVYNTYTHDYKNDDRNNGMISPPKFHEFEPQWNKLKDRKNESRGVMSFKEFLAEKNWIKAYKIHSRIEKARGNPFWRHKGKLTLGYGGVIATAVATKTPEMAVTPVLSAAYLAKDHIKDIVRIHGELNYQDKRERFLKDYKMGINKPTRAIKE